MYFIMRRTSLFLCFLVSFPSFLYKINCHDHIPQPQTQKSGFSVFGDSLYDAGTNNYINTTTEFQANFRPYGESFFDSPTGRFSDGRLIPDFIAEYAKLPLIPTFLPLHKHHQFTYGVNFASGGAGALVETHQGYVVDLKTQLNYFKTVVKKLKQELGETGAKTLQSKSVFLFSVGGNDYFSLFTSNSTKIHSKNEYVGMVIGNLTNAIKEIYKKGGRKFGFTNVPPLGCLPGVKVLFPSGSTASCVADVQELVRLHNKSLSKLLQELESQLQGFRYAKHDLFTSLYQRINNPSKYGFKHATACCGSGPYRGIYSCGGMRGMKEYELCENPGEYLFFDSDHPSEKAYKQIAKLMWNGTSNVTGPNNFKMLFDVM